MAHKKQRDINDVLKSIKEKLLPSADNQLEPKRLLSANLWHAQKNLKKKKQMVDDQRKKHLEALLNEAIASNKNKNSRALQHLIQAECNKQCYAAFCQYTKPKSSRGLAYVTVTMGPDTDPTTIIDHDKLDNKLLEYSRKHFAKAQGSPFTTDNFYRSFKYQTWFSSQGKLWPGTWLASLLVHCLSYIPFSTKIHAITQPNCQCKWSASLPVIIISFLLCLIVALAPLTSVGFPDPGTPIFSREDNTEKT